MTTPTAQNRMARRRTLFSLGLVVTALAGCESATAPTGTTCHIDLPPVATATEPDPVQSLQGTWRVESVESGDAMVAGEHPWNLIDLTITGDVYKARRLMGTTEEGLFSIVPNTSPRQVLFYNWGHREDPRRAVIGSPATDVLRLCMYTRDEGSHSSLTDAPPQLELDPDSAAYAHTALYTFTRESP